MKYELKKSDSQPDGWVLTDTENLVVIRFTEHQYNETQNISILDEQEFFRKIEESGADPASSLAHVLSQMGDYLARHHYSIAMPTPVHELRYSEDDTSVEIIRYKYPKFTIKIEDDCNVILLGNSIKKAGEFVKHLDK